MKLQHTMKALALTLMLALAPATFAAPQANAAASAARSFASPEEAAKALADAVRTEDVSALLAVVGPKSRNWLFSGDRVADRQDWKNFLAAYDRKHSLSSSADGKTRLQVGDTDWSFPAPLVKRGDAWMFDAAAGREEFLNRRIGGNELSTIQTLLAVVDAQREYAADDLDGNGYHDYAQRFLSTPGTRDGLFWPVEAGQPASPLGPLVGSAGVDGYGKKAGGGKPAAYHGYQYRMLKGQGKHAAGGAFDYRVNERMIGGFAVLAFPARYGVSGVMSFLVNHDGTVYQKNLGKDTARTAAGMRLYSPDSSWKKAQ